jgi:hypothetical protein
VPTVPPANGDDLPIEYLPSANEGDSALDLYPRAYGAALEERGAPAARLSSELAEPDADLQGNPLLLRALAGRLMRPKTD